MNTLGGALIALFIAVIIVVVVQLARSVTEDQIAARHNNGNMVPVYFPPATPGGQPVMGYTPREQSTNVFAILALAFGLGGGVLGIIFGLIALSQIRRSGDDGIGMAVTGIICGSLWIIFAIIAMIFFATTGNSVSNY